MVEQSGILTCMTLCNHPKCKIKPSMKYIKTGLCFKHQRPEYKRDLGVGFNYTFTKEDLEKPVKANSDTRKISVKNVKMKYPEIKEKVDILKAKEDWSLDDVDELKNYFDLKPSVIFEVVDRIDSDVLYDWILNYEGGEFKWIPSFVDVLDDSYYDVLIDKAQGYIDVLPYKKTKSVAKKLDLEANHPKKTLKEKLAEINSFEEMLSSDDIFVRCEIFKDLDSLSDDEWNQVDVSLWLPEQVDSAWRREDQVFFSRRIFEKAIRSERLELCKVDNKFACESCNDLFDNLTSDHLLPRRLGGNSRFENLRMICKECNTLKGDLFDPVWLEFASDLHWTPNVKEIFKIR